MTRGVVRFWGQGRDACGLPVPYHSYLVLASPWELQDSGVASIVCISGCSPLAQPNILVQTGGEQAAYEKAVGMLQSLPENHNLLWASDIE